MIEEKFLDEIHENEISQIFGNKKLLKRSVVL